MTGKRSIDYRPAELVLAILDYVHDEDDPAFSIAERDLLEALDTGSWKLDTIKRTVRELVDFGAVRKLSPLRAETRYRLTVLGAAWVDRRLEPYVRGYDEEEPQGSP